MLSMIMPSMVGAKTKNKIVSTNRCLGVIPDSRPSRGPAGGFGDGADGGGSAPPLATKLVMAASGKPQPRQNFVFSGNGDPHRGQYIFAPSAFGVNRRRCAHA